MKLVRIAVAALGLAAFAAAPALASECHSEKKPAPTVGS